MPVSAVTTVPNDQSVPDIVRLPARDQSVCTGRTRTEQPRASATNPAGKMIDSGRAGVAIVDIAVEAEWTFGHHILPGRPVDQALDGRGREIKSQVQRVI